MQVVIIFKGVAGLWGGGGNRRKVARLATASTWEKREMDAAREGDEDVEYDPRQCLSCRLTRRSCRELDVGSYLKPSEGSVIEVSLRYFVVGLTLPRYLAVPARDAASPVGLVEAALAALEAWTVPG
jgi:hypothetical protein